MFGRTGLMGCFSFFLILMLFFFFNLFMSGCVGSSLLRAGLL